MARTRGQGHTPHHHLREERHRWDPFTQAAIAAGSDGSTVLRQFMAWYAGERRARLPQRPPRHPPSAALWTGDNFDEIKAIRPDARLAEHDDGDIMAGDLLVEHLKHPGRWVVIGVNYWVHAR